MNAEKVYYKVVRLCGGGLSSSWAKDNCQMTYKLGETTVAKIGKLFVFDTVVNAKLYLNRFQFYDSYKCSILECTIIGEPITPKSVLDFFYGFPPKEEIVNKFWEEQIYLQPPTREAMLHNNMMGYQADPYRGTILVDGITPIKFV